jgi:pimeloyl-ACP methyl ester carboxylesterase
MPAIMGFPDLTGPFDGPTLFLTGGKSDYVTEAHWPRIAALFPRLERVAVPDAGHWLHAEAPEAFCTAVEAFLTE